MFFLGKPYFIVLVVSSSALSGADMEPFELRPLNVLIGPNGSGKSNIIEALELLRATPTDFAAAIRDGGGAVEWFWKGETSKRVAKIEVETGDENTGLATPGGRALRYRLEFVSANNRIEVSDEAIEESKPAHGHEEPYFYYRFQRGHPVINVIDSSNTEQRAKRHLQRDDLLPDQSVLAQRKDPDLYPELTWFGRQVGKIQMLRDWTFGRYTAPRQPQPADLPEDSRGGLLPDCRNLALVLNQIEHRQTSVKLNELLKRFSPRFERMSTKVSGGSIQFYLHETGFGSPIPATRLSDGTIRFVALLATLLAPSLPPLVCIDEPELGLHPDAVSLLAALLIEASERTQLIVVTHSDALVSALTEQPDAIVACERAGAGTTLRRLDPGKLSHWLKDYRLPVNHLTARDGWDLDGVDEDMIHLMVQTMEAWIVAGGDLWRMGELGANP